MFAFGFLIYEKAVELGLTEIEVEEMPAEMINYWVEVFNSHPQQETAKGIAGKLYSEQHCKGSTYSFIPFFWWSFGGFKNKARSVLVTGPLGVGWLCTKTWFGGSKLGYGAPINKYFYTLSSPFDKKLCSSFAIL